MEELVDTSRGLTVGQRYLTRKQKEAVGLLSIGTFLEYFDLMLFLHMAVLLNELFFPASDPHMAALLSAFAFCSRHLLRPFGALIFGYIGDNIGRKHTVVITTFLMAIASVVMANLPTYAEIGITATCLMIICRMFQSVSSLGEIIGAELYLTEITKPPVQYPAVAAIEIFCALGGFAALALASLVTSFGLNWRLAFWIGALVAVVGALARTNLRETQDFVDAKKQMKRIMAQANLNEKQLQDNPIYTEKVSKKTFLALFLLDCSWPVCFYLAYIYSSNILKNSFGYSAEDVIHQNLMVSMVEVFGTILLAYFSYKIYPLLILKIKLAIFSIFILICPYLFQHVGSAFELLIIQSFIMFFGFFMCPAFPIFFKNLPVFKRFTYSGLSFGLSRALMSTVTSFGFIYLIEYFGYYGMWFILIPIAIGFTFGIFHFEGLEKQRWKFDKPLYSQ